MPPDPHGKMRKMHGAPPEIIPRLPDGERGAIPPLSLNCYKPVWDILLQRLALTVWVVLETLLQRDAEHDGHFERSLKGRRIFVLFDRNDGLPCDADLIGELLLGDLSFSAELPNLIAYGGHQSVLR